MKDVYKVCEVTIHYEPKIKQSERLQIRSSMDIYNFLKEYVFDKRTIQHKESFKVVLLNRTNKILGVHLISQGGISGTVVDVRLIMQSAILSNSSSIILCHNHPSQGHSVNPSNEDAVITRKVKQACECMEIQLLDHVIVSSEGYYSFTDEGVL